MRDKGKKSTEIFVAGASKLLLAMGAEKLPDDTYMNYKVFELKTKLGNITFNIPTKGQNVWTIWGRFEMTPQTDKILLKDFGANPHSGKCNTHLSDRLTAEEALEALEIRLNCFKSII